MTEDIRISTERGALHVQRWRPTSRVARDASPIVLLHDSLGCVELWRDFPQRLADASGRDVVAYDRLGFGRSDAHPGLLETTFVHDEALGDFRRVREALGIGRFVVFGHSVGGGMAVACAVVHAGDCDALVTESAQAFVEDRTVQGIVEAKRRFAQPGQLERLARYHGDKAAWVLHAWIDTWLAPGFAGWNLDGDLRRVHCRVLVVHGDQDEFGSLRHPRRIAELTAPHAALAILQGCGHVPHRERMEAVIERMAARLAGG